jgi:hypothetical protein
MRNMRDGDYTPGGRMNIPSAADLARLFDSAGDLGECARRLRAAYPQSTLEDRIEIIRTYTRAIFDRHSKSAKAG